MWFSLCMPLPFSLLSIMSFVSNCFQLSIFSLSFCTCLLTPHDISQHRAVSLTNPASVGLDQAAYSQLRWWVLLEEETPAPDCPDGGMKMAALSVQVKAVVSSQFLSSACDSLWEEIWLLSYRSSLFTMTWFLNTHRFLPAYKCIASSYLGRANNTELVHNLKLSQLWCFEPCISLTVGAPVLSCVPSIRAAASCICQELRLSANSQAINLIS